jgi:hypothetical protein
MDVVGRGSCNTALEKSTDPRPRVLHLSRNIAFASAGQQSHCVESPSIARRGTEMESF